MVSGLVGPAAIMAGVLTLGGIGALASGNADVIRKWRTWMVSAPLVAGCLWLGTPGAVLLAAGLGVTGAVEYGRLARLRPGPGLPAGPCVIVANHRSHADTAALIAALPAGRRPAVAAAADYWFRGALRPGICRVLCAAFPVRRTGGGSADLDAAARLLAAGHDVIVFPEGTRSRDGRTGRFHRGAACLAAAAGVPLVPAGIGGTGTLLLPDGAARGPRRGVVVVRIGAPVNVAEMAERLVSAGGDAVADATDEARARVVALMSAVDHGH